MHTFIFYRRNILCTPVYRVISKGGFTYNHIGSSTPGGLYPQTHSCEKALNIEWQKFIDFLTTFKTMINSFRTLECIYWFISSIFQIWIDDSCYLWQNIIFWYLYIRNSISILYFKNAWVISTSNSHNKSSTVVWYNNL